MIEIQRLTEIINRLSKERQEMRKLLTGWLDTWDNGGGYPVAETRTFLEDREAIGD